jgi:hypothetical protein
MLVGTWVGGCGLYILLRIHLHSFPPYPNHVPICGPLCCFGTVEPHFWFCVGELPENAGL